MFNLNRYVIDFVVLLVAVSYVVISALIIRNLHQEVITIGAQAATLQQANELLQQSVIEVQRLQQATSQQLATIRLAAAQASRNTITRKLDSDPRSVQQQVNKETTDAFQSIEALSHGH